jgi:hypothetical protein
MGHEFDPMAFIFWYFYKISNMSQAFVRESDDQWLNEVPPTINALINFLTRENGGIRVYEQKKFTDPNGREIHMMSNGLSYTKNDKSEWQVI